MFIKYYGLGMTPTPEEENIFINSKLGIRDVRGVVVAEKADKGSVTRSNPCGTYNGHRVIGWKRAQKRGFVKIDAYHAACCYTLDITWKYRVQN